MQWSGEGKFTDRKAAEMYIFSKLSYSSESVQKCHTNTSYLKLLLLTFASQQKHVIALFWYLLSIRLFTVPIIAKYVVATTENNILLFRWEQKFNSLWRYEP